MKLLHCIIALVLFKNGYCYPLIFSKSGPINGQVLRSRTNRYYYSFTGIPFAKPPIGELRFKSPEPANPWKTTLDASQPTKVCLQPASKFNTALNFTEGDEDCLYLNVYTPTFVQKLPVMFWIHGGSFTFGQSGPAMYGSDFFMDKDIVLVTANYRLGILGFISTEDDVIPGNFGLKDQVLALRWVKENIEQFGGDPNRVTIFGQSAGSVSTGYHFLSPLSKGLFHKAILESGAPLVPWSVSAPGIARQRAKKVANLVGCNSDISNDMLKCLRSINASNLVTQYSKFYEFVNNPEVAFPPTVENCGPNAFICINPLVEFKPVTQVPVIMGLNSAEGGVGIANLCNDTELSYPEFITDFNRVISIMLMYENIALSEDIDNIGKQLLYKYFPKGINNQSLLEAVQLFGDGVILYGVMDMVAKLNSSVYFYLFDHQNEFSFNTQFGPCKKYLGVTHEDEVTLLFRTSFYKNRTLNDDDTKVSKTMINIWTRFASTDIPTIDGQSNGKSWPKFTTMEDSLILLINSSRPKIIKNPLVEKYRFWQKLPHISHLGYINYTFNRYF